MYTVCMTLCVYYTLRTCYPSMLRTRAYASLHEIHWREDEAMWIGCIYQWRWSCQLCFLFGSSVSAHVRVFALVHLFLLLCVCLQVCVIKKNPSHLFSQTTTTAATKTATRIINYILTNFIRERVTKDDRKRWIDYTQKTGSSIRS